MELHRKPQAGSNNGVQSNKHGNANSHNRYVKLMVAATKFWSVGIRFYVLG